MRVSGRKAFWLAQLAGWTIYALVLFLTYLPSMTPDRFGPVFATKTLRIPFGVAGGWVLDRLFRALRTRQAPPVVFVATAFAASLVLGYSSVIAHGVLTRLIGVQPPSRPIFDAGFVRSVAEFGFAFLAWSAAYAGVVLWQLSQQRTTETLEARRRALEAEGMAQEARLQALAYQLNPHFLFNALNSLRAMIDESPLRARQMVTELAGFLRYALLERPLGVTTLADELAALRGYLAIEQVRLEDRLTVEFDITPEAGAWEIPAFLLHPLLENAIKHGREGEKTGTLAIRVTARVEGDALWLEVANTGRLAPAAIGGGTAIPADARMPATGIGLRNVAERLERLYAGRHRFEVIGSDGWVRAQVVVQGNHHERRTERR